jgi:hypothetical protein
LCRYTAAKPRKVQMSNWQNAPLTQSQIQYGVGGGGGYILAFVLIMISREL